MYIIAIGYMDYKDIYLNPNSKICRTIVSLDVDELEARRELVSHQPI